MRAEKFSEILSRAMSNYLKGLLTNEEVIQELLKIAHEIAHGKESDKALDLNDEEPGILRCADQTRGRTRFLYERTVGCHYTGTDRCAALQQDDRLEPQGERPCRYASDRETTAQEV